jgi:DNA-binding transcriptional MerR regulator
MDNRTDSIMYGTKEVCDMVGVSARQLEYWVLIGVVFPIMEPHGSKVFKKFTEEDVRILKEVKSLTDEGVLVSRAAQKVRMKIGGWSSVERGNHE